MSLAVVLPFIDEQVDRRLSPTLHRWNTLSYTPCAPGERLSATAVFFHPLNGSQKEADITRTWSGLAAPARECFSGGVRFLYGSIEPSVAMAHPDGECERFYVLFQLLKGMADTFFIMERSMTPIRPSWLSELVRLAEQTSIRKHVWVLGSVARCDGEYDDLVSRDDQHTTGDALYRVGDPDFDEYLQRVRHFYGAYSARGVAVSGCGTGDPGDDGYPTSIFQYRHARHNDAYAREVQHHFRYTDYVQTRCEDAYDEADMLKRFPDTYLVHSEWPHFTDAERQMRQWYWDRMLQWPKKELHSALVANFSDPVRRDLLEHELCNSERYKRLVSENRPLGPCVRRCERDASFRANAPMVCRLANERTRWANMMPHDQPYVWTTDIHVGPPACNVGILNEIGAKLHAEVDYYNCKFHKSFCKKRLKVLKFDNWSGFSLDPCPSRFRERFFEAYKNDPEFRRVDLFVCSHPAANCELYMPFNRSLLVYATTRLEFGRNDKLVDWRKPFMSNRNQNRWEGWVDNLKRIAARPGNVIAANSMYDVRYIEYMTGLKPIYLPSWCDPSDPGTGVRVRYAREPRQPVLLGMYRDNLDFPNFSDSVSWKHPILQGLTRAAPRSSFKFKRMHELYADYEWWQIMRHPALILIPYQVSVISFFEIYRTAMPIFAPSLRLLCQWVREYGIMWERIYGTPVRRSYLDDAITEQRAEDHTEPPFVVENAIVNDPNAVCTRSTPASKCSLEFWLGLSDWYVFEHVQYFDSWEDLVQKLETANLDQISHAMADFNLRQRTQIKRQWERILRDAVRQRQGRDDDRLWNGDPLLDFNKAMRELYDAQPLPVDPEPTKKMQIAKMYPDATCKDVAYNGVPKKMFSTTKVFKCVNSDDALYYGCARHFQHWALTEDGDTAVSCNWFDHYYVGDMCPRSLPYCEGYRKQTGKQSGHLGRCIWKPAVLMMPRAWLVYRCALPTLIATVVGLMVAYRYLKGRWFGASMCGRLSASWDPWWAALKACWDRRDGVQKDRVQ